MLLLLKFNFVCLSAPAILHNMMTLKLAKSESNIQIHILERVYWPDAQRQNDLMEKQRTKRKETVFIFLSFLAMPVRLLTLFRLLLK